MISKRNLFLGVFIYAMAFLVFQMGANAQETPAAASEPPPAATATVTPESAAAPATSPAIAEKAKPAAKAPAKKRFSKMYAKFETSLGNFTAVLYHTQVPKTVQNFVELTEGTKEWMDPKTQSMLKQPFYDGLIFHRVIKGFVIQGGDPLGLDVRRAGTGGPGFNIPEEFHRDLRFDKPGMLAMAKGNEISGSQFFITLANQERLDQPKPTYPIFGEITEGMDVVLKIGSVATDRRNDRPLETVIIKKITIVRK